MKGLRAKELFCLFLAGLLNAQTLEVINPSHAQEARIFFKVSSNFDLSPGTTFYLVQGNLAIPITLNSGLIAGNSEVIEAGLPVGSYNAMDKSEPKEFEVSLENKKVDIGNNVFINNSQLYCKDSVSIFLNQITREEISCTFYAPLEIVLSASEVVLKGKDIERFLVDKKVIGMQGSGKYSNYFTLNIPARKELSSLEILLEPNNKGLVTADVSIDPRQISSNNQEASFSVSSNEELININTFLRKSNGGDIPLKEVYFIKNPQTSISNGNFRDFFFEGSYNNLIDKVPPGQYIVEAKCFDDGVNKTFRKKFIIPSCKYHPEYVKGRSDFSICFGPTHNLVFNESDVVDGLWYQKFKKLFLTEIYSFDLDIKNNQGPLSKKLPVLINGKEFIVDIEASQEGNSWQADLIVNGDKAEIFNYTYDEMRGSAKTVKQDNSGKLDDFIVSKRINKSQFFLEALAVAAFGYERKFWSERSYLKLRDSTPDVSLSLRLYQFNPTFEISLDSCFQ
jgi:hypothetical protein